MSNEFKITDVVDKSAIQQIQNLRQEFNQTADSYSNFAKILAGGIKIKPSTIQELNDKQRSYKDTLLELIQSQNKLNEIQQKQLNVLSSLKERMNSFASMSALSRQFDELAGNVNKASKALESIGISAGKASEAQQNGAASAQRYTQAMQAASQAVSLSNKEYADIINTVTSYDQKAGELNKELTENKIRIDDIRKQLSILNKEFQRGALSRKDYSERAAELNQLERELNEKNKQNTLLLRDHAKVMVSTSGSYHEMSSAVLQLEQRYKNLSLAQRSASEGQELLDSIGKLKTQLKTIDSQMGNYQRNVGNYKSHWDGLGFSVQQVAREIPSVAYGWNVFFAAISNNLPILSDEIRKARIEFKEITAVGGKATPVWKQLLGSIFSWQTLMVAGITVLTLYGKEIMEWVFSLFKGNSALKETERLQKAVNQAMREAAKDAINETTKLELLYKAATNVNKSNEERLAAIRELKKEAPSYFGLFTEEEIKVGKASLAYKELVNSIIASVKARRTEALIISEENKYLDYLGETANAYIQLQKEKSKYKDVLESGNDLEKQDAMEIIDTFQKVYDEASKKSQQQATNIAKIVNSIDTSALYGDPKEREDASVKNKKYWDEQLKIANDALTKIEPEQLKILEGDNKDAIKKFEEDNKEIAEIYHRATKQRNEANKNLSIYDDVTKTNKEIERDAESHAKYMTRIENELRKSRASSIEQQRISAIEGIKAEYDEKLSKIKGNSEKEKELRESYAVEMKKDIDEVNKKFDYEIELSNLNNKLASIRDNSDKELDAKLAVQLEINEALRKAEVEAAEKRGLAVEIIEKKYAASALNILYEYNDKKAGIIKKETDRQLYRLDTSTQIEINALDTRYNSGIYSRKEYEDKLFVILKEAGKRKFDLLIKDAEAELALSSDIPAKKIKELNDRLAKLKADYNAFLNEKDAEEKNKHVKKVSGDFNDAMSDMSDSAHEYLGDTANMFDAVGDILQKMVDDFGNAGVDIDKFWEKLSDKEKAALVLQTYAKLFSGISSLMNDIYEARIEVIEKEQDANDEAYDKEMERIEKLTENGSITEEDAEKRKQIAKKKTSDKDAELEKKKAEMQTKQAKWEKANAMTQTIISTALAVMKALELGPIVGGIFAGIVAALGAAQLATIAAQPIPKYAKGTDNHPGGPAIVGDGGRNEVILTNEGAFITPAVPTLVDIPKRSVVIPDVVDFERLRRMRSDVGLLMIQADRKGEPFTVNVNNDYSRLEKKTDSLIAETKTLCKYMKNLSNNIDLSNIARRL